MNVKTQIAKNEHVFITGMTGCGKTFLAQTYLAGYPCVLVLDTKGFFEFENVEDVPVFDRLNEFINYCNETKISKVIYRPHFTELNTEFYNKFFEFAYFRMNCIVYVDEVMDVCDNASSVPQYAKGILTRGRQRNTAMWISTQRPKTIPLVFMSEATHYFIFRLNLENDRKRIQEIIPHDEINTLIDKYKFWYFTHTMDKPVLASLVVK
jgi:ABC-type oligopeptide transport system ATPase subunit